jgi:hypothetical protein
LAKNNIKTNEIIIKAIFAVNIKLIHNKKRSQSNRRMGRSPSRPIINNSKSNNMDKRVRININKLKYIIESRQREAMEKIKIR